MVRLAGNIGKSSLVNGCAFDHSNLSDSNHWETNKASEYMETVVTAPI